MKLGIVILISLSGCAAAANEEWTRIAGFSVEPDCSPEKICIAKGVIFDLEDPQGMLNVIANDKETRNFMVIETRKPVGKDAVCVVTVSNQHSKDSGLSRYYMRESEGGWVIEEQELMFQ